MQNSNQRSISPEKLDAIVTSIFSGRSRAFISQSIGCSVNTVKKIRNMLKDNGITSMDDYEKYGRENFFRLYTSSFYGTGATRSNLFLTPDFTQIAGKISSHSDIAIEFLKYEKHCAETGHTAMSKSNFYKRVKSEVELLRANEEHDKEKQQLAYLTQDYIYGVYTMCDHSGLRTPVLTPDGTVNCWYFVVCWPCSNYVYAQLVTSQTVMETCTALANAFTRWGVLPIKLKHDNAKIYVTTRHKGDVVFNDSFIGFLNELHILPEAAKPYYGQGKSQAEANVNLIQTRVHSLICEELAISKTLKEHNRVLMEYVDKYINQAPYRGSSIVTREFLFKNKEKPAARELTSKIPEVAVWRYMVRVPRSYKIKENGHWYSVPYKYIHEFVDIKITSSNVIFYLNGRIIASHARCDGEGSSVSEEHMTPQHKEIKANERLYSSNEDILKEASELNEFLHVLCRRRLQEQDKVSGMQQTNARSNCIAMIKMFKSKYHSQELLSQACKSMCELPESMHTTATLQNIYQQLNRENMRSELYTQHETKPEQSGVSDNEHNADIYALRDNRD